MYFRPKLFDMGLVTSIISLSISVYRPGISFTGALLRLLPWTATVYVLFWLWLYPIYISPLRDVPTVKGFPLWGQFWTIITTEVGVPQRIWHKEHGPIVRYFFPLGSERLSIVDNDALTHIMAHNAYKYRKPLRAKLWMERILGEGVLLAEGNEHARQRKLLSPAFSTQKIKDLAPIFWSKALKLSRCWSEALDQQADGTGSFEVLEWLNRTTLDIIGEAGFGTDINSLDHPELPLRQAYRRVFSFDIRSHIMHGLQVYFPWTKHVPSKMNTDMEFSRDIIVKVANKIVQDKHDTPNNPGSDIMSLIVRANETIARSEQLNFKGMRDQIMTFLGAGHDTTATGVAWTLHLLANHPDIQSKLRREILAALPDLHLAIRDSTSSEKLAKFDVDSLKYLDHVCRESLRYIPPIPVTVRETIEDNTLAGYFVPKGTTIYVLVNTINRLPAFWGETAGDFDPDRWDNLPADFSANGYMTFLQGVRGCIGRKFAEMEMKVLLCSLLSLFEFRPREDLQNPEDLKMWRLVLRPRDGINLNVRLLQQKSA